MISCILGLLIAIYIVDTCYKAIKRTHETIKKYSAREIRDLYWATVATPVTLRSWWEREKLILVILYEMEERGERL